MPSSFTQAIVFTSQNFLFYRFTFYSWSFFTQAKDFLFRFSSLLSNSFIFFSRIFLSRLSAFFYCSSSWLSFYRFQIQICNFLSSFQSSYNLFLSSALFFLYDYSYCCFLAEPLDCSFLLAWLLKQLSYFCRYSFYLSFYYSYFYILREELKETSESYYSVCCIWSASRGREQGVPAICISISLLTQLTLTWLLKVLLLIVFFFTKSLFDSFESKPVAKPVSFYYKAALLCYQLNTFLNLISRCFSLQLSRLKSATIWSSYLRKDRTSSVIFLLIWWVSCCLRQSLRLMRNRWCHMFKATCLYCLVRCWLKRLRLSKSWAVCYEASFNQAFK